MELPLNYMDLIVFRGSQSRKMVHVEDKHSGHGLVVAIATVGIRLWGWGRCTWMMM